MRSFRWLLALLMVLSQSAFLGAEETGLRAPQDFKVSLYADDDLAHDIYSMTIDSQGRVVVAGAGYVKLLHDDDGNGKADRATLFSRVPVSGAHGMCFDGPDLICTGDNALMRLRDTNGDGVADGEPIVLTNLRHPEHGANGVVQGPDGWFYVICGNDAGVSEKHVTTESSPIKHPQCGAVIRVSPDGKQFEVVAHGFRNPYDLAFGADGTMFTVDADGERDQHLPWYSPTRLFDIAPGMHHGWMLQGWQKSWNRPPWFPDNVERLCEIGRGSPTGLIVYRHRQFPERYRGNVFSCCWTLGRVYHFPLERHGSSFRTEKEIFLETTGDVGFAPVDLAVGPDGDLFVAIGGRRTRGSVFRVRYKDGAISERVKEARLASRPIENTLYDVLAADEPLSAWSRARWMPAAKQLDKTQLLRAVHNDAYSVEQRMRAIEILTELFNGMQPLTLQSITGNSALGQGTVPGQFANPQRLGEFLVIKNPLILARIAWSISRRAQTVEGRDALLQLVHWPGAHDKGPQNVIVHRAAWEALATFPMIPTPQFANAFNAATNRVDHRVRFARLLADTRYRPDAPANSGSDTPRHVLDWLWQLEFRDKLEPIHAKEATGLFQKVTDVSELLEAIRIVELAFGDIETSDANPNVLPGYALHGDLAAHRDLIKGFTKTLVLAFPDESREVNLELARLCGMLRIDDARLPQRILRECTSDSSVADDLHYLLVLALLDTPRDESTTTRAADALVRLAGKMERNQLYPSRNWPLRVAEMFERLCGRDAKLAATVFSHAQFGHPDHALFAQHMPASDRASAARRMLMAIQSSGDEWTPEFVSVVALLPTEEAFPLLREQSENVAIRDPIVQVLARSPEPADRAWFVAALASPQPEIAEQAAGALAKLQVQPSDDEWLAVVKTLRRYVSTPQNEPLRAALVSLLSQWSHGDAPKKPITSKDPRTAYQPYFDWFAAKHSQLADRISNWSDDVTAWRDRLAKVSWNQGDVQRGRMVFEKRACHRCHAGSGPLGPDLAGITNRLSRDDLFAHIVDPNKEVSPLYQTTQVVTGRGRIVVGLIVYESPESTLVQTGPDTTVRVTGEEIVSMTKSNQSLMPVGLLNDVGSEELADLYAYLQTVRKQ